MTNYIVLRLDQQANRWEIVDEVAHDNAERAERKTVSEQGEGVYVAIPERSWQPSNYQAQAQIVRVKLTAPEVV